MTEDVVIIGAGQAGASAALKLRALGYSGHLTLVGEEEALPYQRPPLSKKYLTGEIEARRLYLKPEAAYRERAIELKLGRRVCEVARASHQITLDDGQTLTYDRLVLTTGSTPNELPARLGGRLNNVFTFRTLAHASSLQREFLPGRRLVVIGGGYIGLEIAAVAIKRGLAVEIVEKAPRILQRVASAQTARFFKSLHEDHGVTIRQNCELAKINAHDGKATSVTLDSGQEIQADMLVVGIGIRPNTALAGEAGLKVDDGIVVDEFGRTSDPSIFSAGDCTRFPYLDRHVRLESVQNAIEQAENVAKNILDGDVVYLPVPWFWSDQYEAKLQIAGLNQGFNEVIRRPGTRSGESIWYYRDNQFLAVDAINDPHAFMLGKKWLKAGFQPRKADLQNLATDLKALAKN